MVDFVSDLNDGSVNEHAGSVDGTSGYTPPAAQEPVQPKVDTQEKTEKPLSLRDQISSAVKGETETPPIAKAEGPVRNPDGTFAPKPAVTENGEPPAQAPAGTGTQAAPPVSVPAGVDPAVFQSLPAEMQASLARTMEDVNQQQNRYAGYAQIEQIIGPRREAWALNGMTEQQAVGQLFALSDYATRDPAGFISYFAQQSGIDLEELVFNSEPVDPEKTALMNRIAQLESGQQQYETQRQQMQHRETVGNIVNVLSEKDAAGNAVFPYANELGQSLFPHFSAVMQANPGLPLRDLLKQAYDNACWAVPSVRAKMQEAANAASQASRIREQQARTQSAKNAGSSVPSGVPTSAPQTPADGSMSLRDTIRASIANVS